MKVSYGMKNKKICAVKWNILKKINDYFNLIDISSQDKITNVESVSFFMVKNKKDILFVFRNSINNL